MLAKAVGRPPDRRRLAVRAQVGRLPGARVPRRRRGLHAVARPQAARPLLPRAGRSAARRPAGALRPRRRGRHRPRRRASTSRRCCCGSTRPRRGSGCSPRSHRRRFVAWDLLALGDEDLRTTAAGRASRAARGRPRRRAAAGPPDAGDPRSRDGRRLVRPVRGRRARRGRRQAARGAPTSPASGRCSRSSTSARPTASWPGSAGTRTGRARTSGRCCSGCSTTRASSITSASPRRSRGTGAPRSPRSWRRCARTRSTATHGGVGRVGRHGDADASGQRLPGRDVALEPRQGPVVGAAARGARRRGRLRPPPGRPLPARDDVQALATRQAARGVPLRPARGDRALRAGRIFGATGDRSGSGLVGGGWIERRSASRRSGGSVAPELDRRRGRHRRDGRRGRRRWSWIELRRGRPACSRGAPEVVVRAVPPTLGGRRRAPWSSAHPVPRRDAAGPPSDVTVRAAGRRDRPGGRVGRRGYRLRALAHGRGSRASAADPPRPVVARWLDRTPRLTGGAASTRAAARSSSADPPPRPGPADPVRRGVGVAAASACAPAGSPPACRRRRTRRPRSALAAGRRSMSPISAGSPRPVVEVELVSDGLLMTLEERRRPRPGRLARAASTTAAVRAIRADARPVRAPGRDRPSTRSRPSIATASCRPTATRRRRDRPTRAVPPATGLAGPPPGVRSSPVRRVVRLRRRLRLRAGASGARAGRRGLPGLMSARPTGRSPTRAAPGRPVRLRDVDQVDPDAIPERRAAAHPVDEDVRRFEERRGVRMARLPALEALERLRLRRGPGDLDDRDRRLASAGRRRPRAVPLGRQAGVRVAGGDRRGALGGHLGRRAAVLAAARLVLGLGAARLSTAGPAAARRPAWRSSAATARRPGPRPRARALSSSSASSEPTASSIPAPGSPIAAKRAGTVAIVNASASTVGTSSQVSGVETRASGSGRTE